MKQNSIIKNIMNKAVLIIIFLLSFFISSNAQNCKTDTILFSDIRVILPHKAKYILTVTPYEEGVFKTLNFKNGYIILFSGSMVKLPIIDISKEHINSEYRLFNDIRVLRGLKDSCYFREEDYLKYNFAVLYNNVGKEDTILFEDILNNLRIENNDDKYSDAILKQK